MNRLPLVLGILLCAWSASAQEAQPRGRSCTDDDLQFCSTSLTGPMTMSIVPLLQWAKDARHLRDLNHCEVSMREAQQLPGTLGGLVAGIVTVGCGECACRLAFGGPGLRVR